MKRIFFLTILSLISLTAICQAPRGGHWYDRCFSSYDDAATAERQILGALQGHLIYADTITWNPGPGGDGETFCLHIEY